MLTRIYIYIYIYVLRYLCMYTALILYSMHKCVYTLIQYVSVFWRGEEDETRFKASCITYYWCWHFGFWTFLFQFAFSHLSKLRDACDRDSQMLHSVCTYIHMYVWLYNITDIKKKIRANYFFLEIGQCMYYEKSSTVLSFQIRDRKIYYLNLIKVFNQIAHCHVIILDFSAKWVDSQIISHNKHFIKV